MKRLFQKILTLTAVVVSTIGAVNTVQAQTLPAQPIVLFSGSGTAVGSTLSYFIATGQGAGVPAVGYLQYQSDTNTAVCRYYYTYAPITLTGTNTIGLTNLINIGTSGGSITTNTVCIFVTKSNGVAKRFVTGGGGTSTNVVLTTALSAIPNVGDQLFLCSTNLGGTLSGGSNVTTHAASPGYVFSGQYGRPLLFEVNGGGHANAIAVQINSAGGVYVPIGKP